MGESERYADSFGEFGVPIFGKYAREDYEGGAYAVFVKRTKEGTRFFEFEGSHCSCDGIDASWPPKPTTREAILARADKNDSYRMNADDWAAVRSELRKVK